MAHDDFTRVRDEGMRSAVGAEGLIPVWFHLPVSLAQHGQVPQGAPEGRARNLHVVAARDDEGTGDSLALATRVHEPDEMAAAVLALEKQRQVRVFVSVEAERALTIL